MWKLIVAILVGVVAHVVKKLGPSVIIFVYLFFSHHTTSVVDIGGFKVSIQFLLVTLVIILSVLAIVFRAALTTKSHQLDQAAFPLVDQWVLGIFYAYDLRFRPIRNKSVLVLEALKTIMIFTLLAALACLNSILLGVIVFSILFAVAFTVPFMPMPAWLPSRPAIQKAWVPENFAEIVLILCLLAGFLIIVPRGESLLSATAVLLMTTRFSGHIRSFGRALKTMRGWRVVIANRLNMEKVGRETKTD